MKKILFGLFIICLLNHPLSVGQIQHIATNNRTIPSYNYPGAINYNSWKPTSNGPYVMRVALHIIRDSYGNGGMTDVEVAQAMQRLYTAFSPHNICFYVTVVEEVFSNKYYYELTGNEILDLLGVQYHLKSFDIYLLDKNTIIGMADNGAAYPINSGGYHYFPFALIIGGNGTDYANPLNQGLLQNYSLTTSHVISQGMGRAFGLYPTSICYPALGMGPICNTNTPCDQCEDYVCDTPTDPSSFDVLTQSCQWDGSYECAPLPPGQYNPDLSNIMAYISPNCMMHFTPGQGERMRAYIDTEPSLTNRKIPDNYTMHAKVFTMPYPTHSEYQDNFFDALEILTAYNFRVKSGSWLILRAGEKIHVKPSPNGALSSRSEYGSYFHAYIEDFCQPFLAARLQTNPNKPEKNKMITSTEILEQPSFRFYPNPTTGISYVELPSATIYEISVRDLLGREILRKSNLQGKTELNLSGYPKGIYFLQVQTEQGEFFREKVLLE